MTQGVKVRLMAFVILSAVGIVYIAANYLGIVDTILGRGMEVHVWLPTSGGLYVGSEVDDRGFEVGKVTGMDITPGGVRIDVHLDSGTKIPRASAIYVHDLSAVGEQYLELEPPNSEGPYLQAGETVRGNEASIPESTNALLITLNRFVNSVNRPNLRTAVTELATMFHNTGDPLAKLIDSGDRFVAAARANQSQTISLLDTGKTVLHTQAANSANIRAFANGLANITGTLRAHDPDVRTILQGGVPAVREVNSLLRGVAPTMPIFLSNLVTVNQVATARIPAIEQTLVTFPRVIASGFTGTPGDGYGHINIQTNYNVPACTDGYLPPSKWRPASDTTTAPYVPVGCDSGPPYDMRGTKYAPPVGQAGSVGTNYRVAPYDPRTGRVSPTLTLGSHPERQTVFGDNSWEWMLTGPAQAGQ